MWSLRRAVATCCPRQIRKDLLGRQSLRSFLNNAYLCEQEWRTANTLPELQNVNSETFYMTLNREFNVNKSISPTDMDLFATLASLDSSDQLLDDLQDVTHRFRRTPATVHCLPSTSHAIVRAFLKGSPERLTRLVDMLEDRMNYGLFLDYYTANMLMDRFLKLENYRDAAKVASQLMLQEEWQHGISRPLALYCSLAYLQKQDAQPWRPPEPEDTSETVYVRVAYLRNEWMDDHFDLSSAEHVLGKTLAWLSRDMSCVPGASCCLLGWTLYEKWSEVREFCSKLTSSATPSGVTQDTAGRVQQLVSAALEAAGDDQSKQEQLQCVKTAVEQVPVVDGAPLLPQLSEVVADSVKQHEEQDARQMTAQFHDWREHRQRALVQQRETIDRQRRMQALDEKRQYLRERERLLYFFENERAIIDDIDRVWNKPPKAKPAIVYKILRRRKTQEEDYVPPNFK